MRTDPQSKLGMNRTGKDTSPVLSKEMVSETEELTLPRCPPGSSEAIAENREVMMKEVPEGVGSVPVPATLKGALKTALQAAKGNNPNALIDKLGERLAFERTGTRIYDALIGKFKANESEFSSVASLGRLEEIRDEEHRHFLLLVEVIEGLGADPTAVTPSADVTAVASMGIVQVLGDPRIDFIQSLDAILVAELNDTDCWRLLIDMTAQAGLDDISSKFEECYASEQEHLATIRDWVRQFGIGTQPKAGQEVA